MLGVNNSGQHLQTPGEASLTESLPCS